MKNNQMTIVIALLGACACVHMVLANSNGAPRTACPESASLSMNAGNAYHPIQLRIVLTCFQVC